MLKYLDALQQRAASPATDETGSEAASSAKMTGATASLRTLAPAPGRPSVPKIGLAQRLRLYVANNPERAQRLADWLLYLGLVAVLVLSTYLFVHG